MVEIIVPPQISHKEKSWFKAIFDRIDFNELKELMYKIVRNQSGVANLSIFSFEETIKGVKGKF